MTLLANSADPAYQTGYALGQLLFSLGMTLAIAYGVAQLVKNALRRRRDERNGIRYVAASHVPQPGSAYTSWGAQTPPPTGYTAPTGYQAPTYPQGWADPNRR